MIKPIPGPDRVQLAAARVIIVVLDGAGVGSLPDACFYGDEGANTLLHVLEKHAPLKLTALEALGLRQILFPGETPARDSLKGSYGRMASRSPGKDTTSGHWELAGLVLTKPFPTYPRGFPPEVIEPFEKALARRVLGNLAASGTEIIKELGEAHLQSGFPIVYTSADSVFQIAAHEEIIPVAELYRWCQIARDLLQGEYAVGRVIARPFAGKPGNFYRTAGRRDFSIAPTGPTILDLSAAGGCPVAVIGKVADIFNHRGITIHRQGGNNNDVMASLEQLIREVKRGLIWATFGDFDTYYGHRNDSAGFAAALQNFDLQLHRIQELLLENDLLLITADHGCDPTTAATDHTREYVPLLVWSPLLRGGVNLGQRSSLADLGASAAAWLNLPAPENGNSFVRQLSFL